MKEKVIKFPDRHKGPDIVEFFKKHLKEAEEDSTPCEGAIVILKEGNDVSLYVAGEFATNPLEALGALVTAQLTVLNVEYPHVDQGA